MKASSFPHSLLSGLAALGLALHGAAAEESPLAKPLRPFDQNKDGKLTGQELVLARQASKRGGRQAEPSPENWKRILNRRRENWKREQVKALDANEDGNLDDAENKRAEEIWSGMEQEFTRLRDDILRKYDANDDGELTGNEREASRKESDRRREEIERQAMQAAAKPAD